MKVEARLSQIRESGNPILEHSPYLLFFTQISSELAVRFEIGVKELKSYQVGQTFVIDIKRKRTSK